MSVRMANGINLGLPSARIVNVEAVFLFVTGSVLFFFPAFVTNVAVASTVVGDGVHWHLVRCIGAQLVCTAVAMRVMMNSKAFETHASCFLMRIVLSIAALLVTLNARATYSALLAKYTLTFALLYSVCALIMYILLLLQNGWQMGKQMLFPKKVWLTPMLYQLDSVVSLMIGIAWMAFPNWLLRRQVSVSLTDSHLFFGRLMGALFSSSHIISSTGLYWSDSEARKLPVNGRAVMCLGILSAQIWSQYSYHSDWSGNHWVGITLFSTWTIVTCWYRFLFNEYNQVDDVKAQ